jgi:hypothetical protein
MPSLTAYLSKPTQNHSLPRFTYSDTFIHNILTHPTTLPVTQDTRALKITGLAHPTVQGRKTNDYYNSQRQQPRDTLSSFPAFPTV